MHQAITCLVRFQAREGCGEELGLRLCELLLRARCDAACQGCELLHDSQCPESWQLCGQWASEQALQTHLQLPHMQLLGRLVESGLVRRMEMRVEGYSAGLAS